MKDSRANSPARVRNRLRRQVEEEVVGLEKIKRLLGVEGDANDLYDAVVQVQAERDALRRRAAELETKSEGDA